MDYAHEGFTSVYLDHRKLNEKRTAAIQKKIDVDTDKKLKLNTISEIKKRDL